MKLPVIALFVLALVLPVPSSAGTVLFSNLLPTSNPAASGFAVLTLDGLSGDLQVSFSLSAPISTGGIVDPTHTILLYPLTIPFGTGSSGFLDQTFTFSPADAATLWAGDLYVDIFSQNFPGDPGELGGELAVVPEPSTIALLGLGLAVVAWRSARRRVS